MQKRGYRASATAFTLIELLVVIAITAVLISLLMPAIVRARAQANLVACMSRERQLAVVLINYSQSNRCRFPPNKSAPSPGMYWSDLERLGITSDVPGVSTSGGQMVGTVFSCPCDRYPGRTYSMNIWASSAVDLTVSSTAASKNLATFWNYAVRRPSCMILLSESWSSALVKPGMYKASPFIGYAPVSGFTLPVAAVRFGAGGGISPPNNEGPWGPANCDLAFVLHRVPSRDGSTAARGRVNIAFADGHVATMAPGDLVSSTGVLTGSAYWSPLDFQ